MISLQSSDPNGSNQQRNLEAYDVKAFEAADQMKAHSLSEF